MTFSPPLNQIAFSVIDLRATERWFREGFGLLPAGGSRWMMRGPLAARVQGLPGAASTCWWLVGRNPWFQLELFQFERPLAELMPLDSRACDIGYRRIGLWVADFNATLARLQALGSPPLSAVLGRDGKRRACVRNPDGVYVEIMEDDPLATAAAAGRRDCPAAIRSVTMSVPDLDATARFMSSGIGIGDSDVALHTGEHEALWRLAGARTRSKVFVAGDVLVEAVQYLDPAGVLRPQGYRISDQGILNIAFGARSKQDHTTVYQHACAAGARPNCRPLHLPGLGAGVVYVNDPQNFSVEILWLKPGRADRDWGFEPLPLGQRPDPDTHSVNHSATIHAPVERVWAAVCDHEGMAKWSGFSPVTRIVDGAPEADGYGSARLMQGPTGKLVEQVIASDPPCSLRYRVIQGSPLRCHQGEVRLTPIGADTRLDWTIRFRPRIPGSGWVLRRVLQRMLAGMLPALESYLKRH
ncbi:MAG: SRPBCC family protein [Deltaproteobacteria bacterium]|nr:SRPBCC family protein [Deltaproteobacteria bacterium]